MNIVAVVSTIIVNFLANIIPFNGLTTGVLSDAIPNLFVPSGLTFAVWFVIYGFLVAFAVYQGRDLFSETKIEMPYLSKISGYFWLSSVANIAWVFLWHWQYVSWSLLAMGVLLGSLIALYITLGIGKKKVTRENIWEKMLLRVPFSIYLGWITVATIANVTAVLVVSGWNRFGVSEEIWTILVLAIATLIASAVSFTRRDIAYTAVIVWAFSGIAIKRIAQVGDFPFVGYTAIIGLVIDVAVLAIAMIWERRLISQPEKVALRATRERRKPVGEKV